MQQTFFTKTNIAILLTVFLVLAPILAWVTTPHYTAETSRTVGELQKAVTDYSKEESGDQKIPDITITSVKRYNDVWYVLNVTSKSDDQDGKILIADFYHNPTRLQVLSLPFTTAFQGNISSVGVPYAVLDILNNNQKDGINE